MKGQLEHGREVEGKEESEKVRTRSKCDERLLTD